MPFIEVVNGPLPGCQLSADELQKQKPRDDETIPRPKSAAAGGVSLPSAAGLSVAGSPPRTTQP